VAGFGDQVICVRVVVSPSVVAGGVAAPGASSRVGDPGGGKATAQDMVLALDEAVTNVGPRVVRGVGVDVSAHGDHAPVGACGELAVTADDDGTCRPPVDPESTGR